MRPLLVILSPLVIAAPGAAIPPASASSSAPPIVVEEDCLEGSAVVPGVEERVRQRVPAQFELVRDPLGRPLLFAVASRCARITAGGTTKPTTSGLFLAVIESPDGEGCMSRWPLVGDLNPDLLPLCNFYFLSGAYDNQEVVRTFRALFPGMALRYVPDLAFQAGGLDLTSLGAPLHFRAGPPTPSPFELDGVLREQPVGAPTTLRYFTGSSPTVGARFEIDDFALGQMDATLRAAPGSEMAELLGTETPTPIAGLVDRHPHGEVRLLGPGPVCKGRPATIVGSGQVNGTATNDVIVSGKQGDLIDGQGGNDRICAGRGPDRLRGGRGHDRLFGEEGPDRLFGGPGRDKLKGGAGKDSERQ